MFELSVGRFPYDAGPNLSRSPFLLLKTVCDDDPPRLPDDPRFSPDYRDFIVQCLQKDFQKRPNYTTLMKHPLIEKYKDEDIAEYVANLLDNSS